MAMPRFVFPLVWLIVTIRCFDKCNKQNRRRRFCLFACFVLDLHCWCFGARKIALALAKFSSGVTKRFSRWNFLTIWELRNFTKCLSENGYKATATLHVMTISISRGLAKASRREKIYVHRRGAFGVARFDRQGQCEGLQIVERACCAPRFWFSGRDALMHFASRHKNLESIIRKCEFFDYD